MVSILCMIMLRHVEKGFIKYGMKNILLYAKMILLMIQERLLDL
ncbi:unknown [Prevotella sp. CAG:255]|nr:unknown [Prevotella sp. CAG:255]